MPIMMIIENRESFRDKYDFFMWYRRRAALLPAFGLISDRLTCSCFNNSFTIKIYLEIQIVRRSTPYHHVHVVHGP